MSQYFYILLLLPLIASALSLAFRGKRSITSKISIKAALVQFVFSLFLLQENHASMEMLSGNWPAGIGIKFKLDLFANMMITVVSAVYLAGSIYFIKGKTVEESINFNFLYNALFLGLTGSFFTQDLFNLFVWFEVTLMSSYVLVVADHNLERTKAGLKYIILNFLSGLIFLLAVGLIYKTTKTLDFMELKTRLATIYLTNPGTVRALALLLFSAFAIKSAFFPFFFWLPESYPKLSAGLSGVFAGLLTKLGLYAMVRIFGQVFPPDDKIFMIVLILASLSLIIGVWGAIVQSKIRSILSYHVISQVGFIGIGIGLSISPDPAIRQTAIAASLFYIVHHIIVKTNLFFVSGIINLKYQEEDVGNLSGIFKTYPLIGLLFLIPAASLIGIPPFSGFWAKLNLFKLSLVSRDLWIIIVMIIGSFFTLFSMVKIWEAAFWGKPRDEKKLIDSKDQFIRPILASLFLGAITIALSLNPTWLHNISLQVGKDGLTQTK